MKRFLLLGAAAIIGGFSFQGVAHAQVANAQVLSSCGTASYTAGYPFPNTQDTTGKSCGSVTVTPTYYSSMATNSSPITVGASASLIVAARASRAMLIIINESANPTRCSSVNTVTSGGGGATTGGFQITATIGASVTLLNYSGALYCAGATTVSATEVY